MSLDVCITDVVPEHRENVWDYNITHNLGEMATAAGLYMVLWRPEEIGISTCAQALPILRDGLEQLLGRADEMKAHNPANGWGSYDGLVRFVRSYIAACEAHPNGTIETSR
jgi:hypothetical protein